MSKKSVNGADREVKCHFRGAPGPGRTRRGNKATSDEIGNGSTQTGECGAGAGERTGVGWGGGQGMEQVREANSFLG